jgi:hypothetical protein
MSGSGIVSVLALPDAADRLPQRRGVMVGDSHAFEPDAPCSVEVLTNEDTAAGIAAAVGSGRDIDDQSAKPDRVGVVDSGFVGEGDELIALGGADLAERRAAALRSLGEAPVEAGDIRPLEPGVGRIDLGDPVESHFGDETILEGAALALDTALGLGREGRDGPCAQLLEDPSHVGREADPGQLLLMTPEVIVAEESAVAVLIDGRRDAVAPEDHVQELEVADGILLGPEEGAQDGPGRVIGGMEEAHGGPLRPEPVVGAAVPLHKKPDLRPPRTPAPMLRWSAAPLRPDPRFAEPAADRLPPYPKPLPLLQHLDEVGVVELGVDLSMEPEDPLANFMRTAPAFNE